MKSGCLLVLCMRIRIFFAWSEVRKDPALVPNFRRKYQEMECMKGSCQGYLHLLNELRRVCVSQRALDYWRGKLSASVSLKCSRGKSNAHWFTTAPCSWAPFCSGCASFPPPKKKQRQKHINRHVSELGPQCSGVEQRIGRVRDGNFVSIHEQVTHHAILTLFSFHLEHGFVLVGRVHCGATRRRSPLVFHLRRVAVSCASASSPTVGSGLIVVIALVLVVLWEVFFLNSR